MDFLKKHIFTIFLPLLLDIVFLILVGPFFRLENLVPSITKEGSFLIYFYVITLDLVFLIAYIIRRELLLIRIIISNLLFLLMIIFNFIYKDNSIFELSLFVFLAYDAVFSLFKLLIDLININKEKTLPPNRFTVTRKSLSRFITSLGFIIAFFEMFLLFYFVGSSIFVWFMAVALAMFTVLSFSSISLSINYNPLVKLEKSFLAEKDYKVYLEALDGIDQTRLHKETINLIQILKLQTVILFELESADIYLEKIFVPKKYDNISPYYYTLFLYYLYKDNHPFLLANKALFLKKTKQNSKKIIADFYALLEGKETKKPFYKKKKLNFRDLTLKEKAESLIPITTTSNQELELTKELELETK